MTKASLKAYLDLLESGKLKGDKQKVFNAINKFPGVSIPRLKKLTGLSHQTLTARLSDLMDEGVVFVDTNTKESNYSIFYCTRNYFEAYYFKKTRRNQKLDKILKRLKNQFSDLIDVDKLQEIKR